MNTPKNCRPCAARRFFGASADAFPWGLLFVLYAFRLWFSAALPMTGDEAYFIVWGEHPAGGYYDHPPMVGWWLSALLAAGRAEWWLRLPATLLPLILAWGGWQLVRSHDEARARLAAVLILLQPANVWNVLITTDTPVILFSMLSALAYVAAVRRASFKAAWFRYALAGILLGLAFLGKYFAALLGVAYLVHVALIRRAPHRWAGFFILFFAALPAPIYNLWWNSRHCWVNILFNFVNRNESAGFSWANPALYALSVAYLCLPWLFIALVRRREAVRAAASRSVEASAALWLLLVPLALFAAMSLWRSVGLHWFVSFVPLAAVLAALVLSTAELTRLVRLSAVFAFLHGVVFIVLLSLPLSTWKSLPIYDGIFMRVRAAEIVSSLRPYAEDHLLAMESYSSASTLAYFAGRPFAVFGGGSVYGREDDVLTDWRAQEGRNILILRMKPPKMEDYAPFFDTVRVREIEWPDGAFYLVIGEGFRYGAYHERILTRIRERFYRIPQALPDLGCAFCERYFPERRQ